MTLFKLLRLCNDCYQEFIINDVNNDGDIEDGDHLACGTICDIYDEIKPEEYQVKSFNLDNNNNIVVWVFKLEGV